MDARDARHIVDALDRNSKALNRLARAQEDANKISIDIEKNRREKKDQIDGN